MVMQMYVLRAVVMMRSRCAKRFDLAGITWLERWRVGHGSLVLEGGVTIGIRVRCGRVPRCARCLGCSRDANVVLLHDS